MAESQVLLPVEELINGEPVRRMEMSALDSFATKCERLFTETGYWDVRYPLCKHLLDDFEASGYYRNYDESSYQLPTEGFLIHDHSLAEVSHSSGGYPGPQQTDGCYNFDPAPNFGQLDGNNVPADHGVNEETSSLMGNSNGQPINDADGSAEGFFFGQMGNQHQAFAGYDDEQQETDQDIYDGQEASIPSSLISKNAFSQEERSPNSSATRQQSHTISYQNFSGHFMHDNMGPIQPNEYVTNGGMNYYDEASNTLENDIQTMFSGTLHEKNMANDLFLADSPVYRSPPNGLAMNQSLAFQNPAAQSRMSGIQKSNAQTSPIRSTQQATNPRSPSTSVIMSYGYTEEERVMLLAESHGRKLKRLQSYHQPSGQLSRKLKKKKAGRPTGIVPTDGNAYLKMLSKLPREPVEDKLEDDERALEELPIWLDSLKELNYQGTLPEISDSSTKQARSEAIIKMRNTNTGALYRLFAKEINRKYLRDTIESS